MLSWNDLLLGFLTGKHMSSYVACRHVRVQLVWEHELKNGRPVEAAVATMP